VFQDRCAEPVEADANVIAFLFPVGLLKGAKHVVIFRVAFPGRIKSNIEFILCALLFAPKKSDGIYALCKD